MKKAKRLLYTLVKGEALTVFCGVLILLGIKQYSNIDKNGIDLGVLLSMIIMAVLTLLVFLLRRILLSWLEDSGKFIEEYGRLTSTYEANFLIHKNVVKEEGQSCRYKKHLNREYKFPIICDKKFYGNGQISELCIEDNPKKIYYLPRLIEEHYDEIMKAHSASRKYNQLCVRVDDWGMKKKAFVIRTSRTTYYHTLVTNRAMDFQWRNGTSIREHYLYGPFIPRLKHSEFSNHLGCNGFIETADGYITLVKRAGTTTIAKHVYGGSFGLPLKIRDVVDSAQQKINYHSILKSVKKEICQKYNLSMKEMEQITGDAIAVYRDVVEGGKPQMLFYMKLGRTKKDIEEQLKRKNVAGINKNKVLKARRVKWIHTEELKNLCILPDAIISKRKKYSTVPTVAASLLISMEYLGM